MTRLLTALALCLALPAQAQDNSGHAGHTMPEMTATDPASLAFAEANDKMHAEMNIPFTGNTDVDFIRGMIPHHKGAVDMARIVLEYGSDPEVRKLAEAIIAAQEEEIRWMEDWLAKNGG